MFISCRIGEGRACWSLGNAYTALGNHDQAMHFAERHLEISREVWFSHSAYVGWLGSALAYAVILWRCVHACDLE